MPDSGFKVQWYPGHMAKAKRRLASHINQVDFVVEVVDARAPMSTRNPDLNAIIHDRPRLLVLAKADLAEPGATRLWEQYLRSCTCEVVSASFHHADGVRSVKAGMRRLARSAPKRSGSKPAPFQGVPGVVMPDLGEKTLRGMVVGMPNTGKSTLIGALGGRGAGVGARPGVTRGLQWITVARRMALLDTPGLMWPRSEVGETAAKLVWVGCIGDAAYDREGAAVALIRWFQVRSFAAVVARYGSMQEEVGDPAEVLRTIARRRGHLTRAGRPDSEQAAHTLLVDFRRGLLGRVSLDEPPGPN